MRLKPYRDFYRFNRLLLSAVRALDRFAQQRPFKPSEIRRQQEQLEEIRANINRLLTARIMDEESSKAGRLYQKRYRYEMKADAEMAPPFKVAYEPCLTTHQFVCMLLEASREAGKYERVSKHLVGAKLQLRFPAHTIENKISSAADQTRGRSGDFQIGDTVFHVTVAPGPLIYEKCRTNISNGLRVYLLVPEAAVVGAKQNAEQVAEGKIAVISIEAFVSQNVDELGQFDSKLEKAEIARLLSLYNQRVDQIEYDKSLLIKISAGLEGGS